MNDTHENPLHSGVTFHITNLGTFGRGIPTDLDGIVHLPGSDWRDAHLEGITRTDYEQDPEWADQDWADRCTETARLVTEAEKKTPDA